MHKEEKEKHIKSYYNFRDSLKRVDKVINNTMDLNKNNYKIYYCIDFSELFSYIFKLHDIESIDHGPWESTERLIVRERLTLEKLFNNHGTLVLLPPHLAELKAHMDFSNAEQFHILDSELYKEIKNKLSNNNTATELLKEIENKLRKNEALNNDDKSALNNIIKENFGEYKYFNSYLKLTHLIKLNQLFTTGKIIGLTEFIEEIENETGFYITLYDDIIERQSITWYEEFLKGIRNSAIDRLDPEMILNRKRDAIACSYIKQINKLFIEAKNEIGSNLYLSFVSRSSLTLDVLDLYASEKVDQIEFWPSRNLESIYFLNTLFVDGELQKSSYDYFKNILKHLFSLREKYKTDRMALLNEEQVDSILLEIELVYNELLNRSNIEMYLHENPYSYKGLQNVVRENDTKEILDSYRILISILKLDTEIETELIKYLRNTNLINKTINELNKRLIDIPSKFKIKIKSIHPKHGYTLFSFEGIKGEMSTEVKLYDEESKLFAKKYFEGTKSNYGGIVYNYKEVKDKDGLKIIWAYNFASDDRFQKAIDLLETIKDGVDDVKKDTYKTACYLKLQIYRKLALIKPGLKICKQFDNPKNQDPRFLREYGVLIWLTSTKHINFRKQIEHDFKISIDIKTSINLTAKAYRLAKDKELKLRCLNSLAYYYAELDNLDYANKYVFLLNEYIENNKSLIIPPRFYDTFGYIKLKEAEGTTEKEERIKYLEEALDYFQMASKSKSIINYEEEMVSSHLFRTKLQLQVIKGEPLPFHV